MKLRLVFSTVIFLLLFSLKMGTGLLLHNLFHEISVTSTEDHPPLPEDGLSYACHCIDDFLSPFAESTVITISSWVSSLPIQGKLPGQEPVCRFLYSSRLRGPPGTSLSGLI